MVNFEWAATMLAIDTRFWDLSSLLWRVNSSLMKIEVIFSYCSCRCNSMKSARNRLDCCSNLVRSSESMLSKSFWILSSCCSVSDLSKIIRSMTVCIWLLMNRYLWRLASSQSFFSAKTSLSIRTSSLYSSTIWSV